MKVIGNQAVYSAPNLDVVALVNEDRVYAVLKDGNLEVD